VVGSGRSIIFFNGMLMTVLQSTSQISLQATVSLQERGWRRSALTGKTSRRNYQKSSN